MAKLDNKNVRKIVFNKYGGKCAYCGVELADRFTIDHIVPKRRNNDNHPCKGANTIDNYNPSCQSCNSSKSDWTLNQWRFELEEKYARLKRDSATFRSLVRFGLIKKTKNDVTFYFETL